MNKSKTSRAPTAKDQAQYNADVAAERLNKAILSFAHGVNNNFEEVLGALQKADQNDLVDELTELMAEWRDASTAAFDSFNRPQTKGADLTKPRPGYAGDGRL